MTSRSSRSYRITQDMGSQVNLGRSHENKYFWVGSKNSGHGLRTSRKVAARVSRIAWAGETGCNGLNRVLIDRIGRRLAPFGR